MRMRRLVLLGSLATAHAFTNGTCLENLPDSISCRWRTDVSAWDASPRPRSSVAVVYYQPPTLKQGDVGLIRALDVWTQTTQRKVLLLNVAALEKARPAHPAGRRQSR